MKFLIKEPKSNRVRIIIQSLDDRGKPVVGKTKQIILYETTIEEVYQICLEALRQKAEGGK